MEHDVRRIEAGWDVYSRDNEKVGEIHEVGPNYLLVRKGWLFTRDIYVPLSAVADVQPDLVVLNVRKDEIDQRGWDVLPPEEASPATTTTGISAASTTLPRADTTAVDTDVVREAPVDATTAATRRTDVAAGEEVRIPVVEEAVRVGKREVETGGVRVTKRVEEQPVAEQVTLRDETVHVERRPVDRPVADADFDAVREGTFEVRERHEEAVVDKQARVTEEVVVRKDAQERTEAIQDTVRRTDVEVEQVGGERMVGDVVDTDVRRTSGYGEGDVTDEGAIERGASKLGNAVERATDSDLDRDGDVGQRDPRDNI